MPPFRSLMVAEQRVVSLKMRSTRRFPSGSLSISVVVP